MTDLRRIVRAPSPSRVGAPPRLSSFKPRLKDSNRVWDAKWLRFLVEAHSGVEHETRTAQHRTGVLAATFVVLGTGCETLHPQGFAMEPIENYGGGGGDAS